MNYVPGVWALLVFSAVALAQKAPVQAKPQPAAARVISIVNIRITQYEDGPAVPAGQTFVPGESVFLSFQVAGYQKDEQEKILVVYRLEAKDPEGVAIVPPMEGKVAAELSPEDKDWLPKVREQIIVPPAAPSGTYRVEARVKDNLSGTEATKGFDFVVRGHAIRPAKQVETQNFRWSRSENDIERLPETASYRPADTVWAKFDIVGFRHAEKNRYAVQYGLAVLDAGDKELYSVPEAASDAGESFYAKRYVPGILSFSLPADIKAGTYTVVLTVRDTSGNQQSVTRHQFRVE